MTTSDGQTFTGDYLVLAAGSRPNFFHTPGADEHALPLYTVEHAEALRTRVFEVFEEADTNPARIAEGAVNIVIVGAGRMGVLKTAGALADLVNDVMPGPLPRPRRPVSGPASTSWTTAPSSSAPFSDKAHALTRAGPGAARRDASPSTPGSTRSPRTRSSSATDRKSVPAPSCGPAASRPLKLAAGLGRDPGSWGAADGGARSHRCRPSTCVRHRRRREHPRS